MVYSFNNFYNKEKIPEYFSTVVLGKQYLRNFKEINHLIKDGRKIKLLLNNGCSFNCGTCRNGTEQCFETVKNNLVNNSLDDLFAIQTIFPWELYEITKRVEDYSKLFFKISNRTR